MRSSRMVMDPFVTASQNSDDASKTDFVIDIAAAAEALAGLIDRRRLRRLKLVQRQMAEIT